MHLYTGDQALYAWFYPGFMINRYGPVMDTNYVIPISHDKTLVVFDFFFDENTESFTCNYTYYTIYIKIIT